MGSGGGRCHGCNSGTLLDMLWRDLGPVTLKARVPGPITLDARDI